MDFSSLLAQQGPPFGPGKQGAGDAEAAAALGSLLCVYGVILVVAIIVQIIFLNSMSKCLKQVSPRNRKMEPGQVWLCLIPLFGFIWAFIMVLRVSESLDAEFRVRRLQGDGDFGKTIGLVYLISAFVCGLVSLVCWIIYWSKISGYTKQLVASGGSQGRDDYDDDDDDDRGRRRRDDDFDDR